MPNVEVEGLCQLMTRMEQSWNPSVWKGRQ